MSATEGEIRSWIGGYDRDFDQLCQALMWQLCNRFGKAPVAYATAKAAARATPIVSLDPNAAPGGAFHYWGMGSAGHVAFGLGGSRVFMGSKRIQEAWGRSAGVTTVQAYNGSNYLGWGLSNGSNDCDLVIPAPPAPVQNSGESAKDRVKRIARYLNARDLRTARGTQIDTGAWSDGDPGVNYWMALQIAGSQDGLYPQPAYKIDGDPGSKTYWLESHYALIA